MFSLLQKFFDSNDKEIKKLLPLIEQINELEKTVQKIKDKDFPKKTKELQERFHSGQSLELLLPEAFALVREAAKRVIGQRHYDVQLMASISLALGNIAEQKTGEGKTLSAVPALYLHTLTGRNVHLVTVNDYLARRDAGWMGPIFHFLGVSVAAIINDKSFLFDPSYINDSATDFRLTHLKEITRKEAYQTDVVYGINSEFGFDYLRDNMAQELDQVVQRDHFYAIVDEVDSVLIDEARTPHIISAPDEVPTQKYYEYAKLIEKLSSATDYQLDEKLRTAHLTEHGISKIEKMFNMPNIYEKDFDTVYHLEAALKARTLFHKEKDYIVKDGQVILVDEFTGRLMQGRRLSEGLHQAIEAKEGVVVQRESKTLATISLQNYFRMYEKLAGMTGTAATEAEEFHKIYNLDVITIPTYKKLQRNDFSDAVYKTTRAKLTAIADGIEKAYKTGQPVLVGTTSIDKNEVISQLLTRRGIKHKVLNAKNHEGEAEIIAQAGKKSAVTVATNMAGRGVDIILGGESPKNEDGTPNTTSAAWKTWEKDHDEVLSLGGLFVIGTERHESRRIDNQLRGRSGRQGDLGSSQFFVSLEDEIMRLFGGNTIANLMTRFNLPEDVPLQHGLVSRAIEQAQIKVEGFYFDGRKHVVEYDDVLNKQREIIYRLRKKVLESSGENKESSLNKEIIDRITQVITTLVQANNASLEGEAATLIKEFITIIPLDVDSQNQINTQLIQRETPEERIEFLVKLATDVYMQRTQQLGEELSSAIERFVMLSVIDTFWMNHLDAIENLRQGIGLRGYGQRDPLVEYKNEAYKMFENLVAAVDDEIVHRIYKVNVEPTPTQILPSAKTNEEEKLIDGTSKKVGRNDPCWCGSGKKYKYCHLKSS